jgi:hypothetical protein
MSLIGSRHTLRLWLSVLLIAMMLPLLATAQAAPPTTCQRQTTAQVVALDQPFFLNRLGALEATGMMFALKRDVVPISGTTLTAGNVQLRSDKRPRPLVLRRRSASMRRKSTGRSMPQEMAGSISPASSSTSVTSPENSV